ncbi:MAG: hypothetical protein Q9166_007030 [cf. Caloplaca sp. 2 TL-2023]
MTTYYEYFSRLEQEVQKRPYSRAHQEKLSAFRQEISGILRVLEDQSSVVDELQQKLDCDKNSIMNLGRRREDLNLHECLTTLGDRITNFNPLERHARDLASFNLLRIESSKDRQEAAILVFTVVTIIFLPLSFVSSFFGMNTADIRETKFPQCIFWASALPLTITVVIVSPAVAQKIEPIKDLWSRVHGKWSAVHNAPAELYRHSTVVPDADAQNLQSTNVPRSRLRYYEPDYQWSPPSPPA